MGEITFVENLGSHLGSRELRLLKSAGWGHEFVMKTLKKPLDPSRQEQEQEEFRREYSFQKEL